MSINNFPTALVPIIQTGYLEHKFEEALLPKFSFRNVATKETFRNNVGETITKTRNGLKGPRLTPITGSSNTNLDNGLSSSTWTVEQYSLALGMYADTIDLNTVTQQVGIANQFIKNAEVNAIQAAQTVDRLARNTLFQAAMAGNTRVTANSSNTIVAVDDITGFTTNAVNGIPVAVSSGNPLAVTIGANSYTVIAAVATGPSTNPFGNTVASQVVANTAGTLTLSTSVNAGDCIANASFASTVTASTASSIIRAGGASNTLALASTNSLTMANILDGVAILRKNAVPPLVGGDYVLFLDPVSERQLFSDPDFKQLYQGATGNNAVFKHGKVVSMLGVTFVSTTDIPTQVLPSGLTVRRSILVGADALIEGGFENPANHEGLPTNAEISEVEGILMVTREALDRLQQIIAQSWYWIGAFTAPTDVSVSQTIIPTATNASFKRLVCFESVG